MLCNGLMPKGLKYYWIKDQFRTLSHSLLKLHWQWHKTYNKCPSSTTKACHVARCRFNVSSFVKPATTNVRNPTSQFGKSFNYLVSYTTKVVEQFVKILDGAKHDINIWGLQTELFQLYDQSSIKLNLYL